jgi:hypothetical protein
VCEKTGGQQVASSTKRTLKHRLCRNPLAGVRLLPPAGCAVDGVLLKCPLPLEPLLVRLVSLTAARRRCRYPPRACTSASLLGAWPHLRRRRHGNRPVLLPCTPCCRAQPIRPLASGFGKCWWFCRSRSSVAVAKRHGRMGPDMGPDSTFFKVPTPCEVPPTKCPLGSPGSRSRSSR